MNACGAALNHGFHQLECVQVAAETGFGIGDQRSKPVHSILAFRMMNLVRSSQGLIEAATKIGHAVGGIQALVGIHLPGIIGVGRNLPAAHVDRLQSGFYLLHRLVAGHGTEGCNVRLAVQEVPKPLRALPSQCVLDVK